MRKTLLILLLLLVLPASAQAQTGVAVQNDDACLYGSNNDTDGIPTWDEQLDRTAAVHGDTVRLMVPDSHWRTGESDRYVACARVAKERGFTVFASLLAWNTYPTPAEWAAYANEVVGRMAPYVDAWSVMNEPNWPGMSPHTDTSCKLIPTAQSSVSSNGTPIVRYWKKVKHGTHKRIAKRVGRKHHRHWAYTFKRVKHGGRYKRAVRKGKPGVTVVSTVAAHHDCYVASYAVAYADVYNATAPVIKSLDPDAKIVAGDLAPGADMAAWMNVLYATNPSVRPDVCADHPYTLWQGDGPPNVWYQVTYTRAHGCEYWATEFGHSSDQKGAVWVASVNAMLNEGATLVVLYDSKSPTWDTQMRPSVMWALTHNR